MACSPTTLAGCGACSPRCFRLRRNAPPGTPGRMAGTWRRPRHASLRQPGLAQTVVVPLDESVEFRVVCRLGPKPLLLLRKRIAGVELLEDSQGGVRLGVPTEQREGACLQREGGLELWIRH